MIELIPSDLGLSIKAMSLWGKTNRKDNGFWLQLFVHLSDSTAVAERLWLEWVPSGTKEIIIRDVGDPELARKVSMFIAGVHDIGKATPVFQSKPLTHASGIRGLSLQQKPQQAGLKFPNRPLTELNRPTHSIAGQKILESYLTKVQHWDQAVARSYACVVGGHHGQPPKLLALCKSDEDVRIGVAKGYEDWVAVQRELIKFIASQCGLTDDDFARLAGHRLKIYAESVLEGLVIMADWIASNCKDELFPLVPLNPQNYDAQAQELANSVRTKAGLRARQERGWRNLKLTPKWEPVHDQIGIEERFASRFELPPGAHPRPVQEQAVHLAETTPQPGIMVIEAPMGEGKTEAALACAEILAERTGRGGVCVALPTMATTDAMFSRCKSWIDHLPQPVGRSEKSTSLRHSKATLNKEFMSMGTSAASAATSSVFDDDYPQVSTSAAQRPSYRPPYPEAIVNDWFYGRKKGVLANFLICTVDQVLMAALEMKHVSLRQLALANKVVIIDECHAYDTYMREYLKRTLEWLGGFHAPVILLSATLPTSLRKELVDVYLKGYASVINDSDRKVVRSVEGASRRFQSDSGCTIHQSTITAEDNSANARIPHEQKLAVDKSVDSADMNAYPLITYTSGTNRQICKVQPSGRSVDIDCQVIDDDIGHLVDLLQEKLADGGCAAVICDTVRRAQRTAAALTEVFDPTEVRLTHSRFIDRDRMDNERSLREDLGPEATLKNGKRPRRLVVVGTQVLEQSLDIDFDLVVTDVAPIDTLLQRMGRLHRHHRGKEESDRPVGLQRASCYLRGIGSWTAGGPTFSDSVDCVYEPASLLEGLAVLCLHANGAHRQLCLPDDIALLVRTAYEQERVIQRIPQQWRQQYYLDVKRRAENGKEEIKKANAYLIRDSAFAVDDEPRTLVNLFEKDLGSQFEEEAQRAVRDINEYVEVILLRQCDHDIALLPWVGGENVPCGSPVPTDKEPSSFLAQLILQSAVRIPLPKSRKQFKEEPRQAEDFVSELDDRAGGLINAWRNSPWLHGCHPLVLSKVSQKDSNQIEYETKIGSYRIGYSRKIGLTNVVTNNPDEI